MKRLDIVPFSFNGVQMYGVSLRDEDPGQDPVLFTFPTEALAQEFVAIARSDQKEALLHFIESKGGQARGQAREIVALLKRGGAA
jgi:hypothetical protein